MRQLTIEQYYEALPYGHILSPSEGRAFLPEVDDGDARAGLMEVLAGCASGEIEVYLDMVLRSQADGMYLETCLLGIVAALRGARPWPMAPSPWRHWETKYIYAGGPADKRAVLIAWLQEMLGQGPSLAPPALRGMGV